MIKGLSFEDSASLVPVMARMGRYWRDPLVFTADCIETSERHIIDDMIF